MNQDLPLYNSRLIKMWVDFLKIRYPRLDIDTVLDFAGIKPHNLNDLGHWLTQQQTDRFAEALVKMTNNPNISKEAGRHYTSSEGLGPVKQWILGLIDPMSMYMLMGRTISMLSRAHTTTATRLADRRVKITSVPKPGITEKPYQCENRLGAFESLAELFTRSSAKVEHPVCFHKGGDSCQYIITWDKSPSHYWERLRNVYILLSISIPILLYFFLPVVYWSIIALTLAIAGTTVSLYAGTVVKKELVNSLKSQGNAAEALLDEINIRHNNALLIQEVGQATSIILDIANLVTTVLSVLERRSSFDRGLIMLANASKSRLSYYGSYGYTEGHIGILRNTSFHLDNPKSKGAFVVAFKDQKPFLIEDIKSIEETISKRSFELIKKLDVQSLICVPIIYENESIGILAVDNIHSKKQFTQSDVSLLTGVASQTAVSIMNARSFQKLQESEEKYRDLVENANSIIMRRDTAGNITFFNEFAQNLFGYSVHEILGKNIVGTILPAAEESRIEIENLAATMQTYPEKRFISEDRHILRSEEAVWVTWTHKPIFGQDGTLQEILCIGNDITELKQAEKEKRELEIRLQRAQKMEAVGTLAGGVAHDLNNILSGIVSYPELILMGLPEDSPLQKPVRTIQKSGEKAAAIVQDLLTLARRGVVTKKVISLNDVVAEYLRSPEFDYLLKNHPAVQVKTRLGKDLLNIQGSPVHLSKTLMNLVSNAAEAMPSGGTVHISTQNRCYDESFKGFDEIKEGDYVALKVKDTGIGIPEQDIERIFEPFYTKKVMGRSGTGLGMAVVWGTVKDHDGYIDVQSIVGKGTKFTLYFPVSRAESVNETVNLDMQSLRGRNELILVVDDAPEQREIASSILEKLGYSVSSVASGEEAVEYLKSHPVDLVILDMIMAPGIDGYETYKRILKNNPHQKAIIASGFSETKRVKAAQEIGAGVYIKKPYLFEKIAQAVRGEIDR